MTLIVLESGAVIVAVLVAAEMLRQQRSGRVVIISSLAVLGVLTAMIVMWRGH